MKFVPELLCFCFLCLFENTFCDEEGRVPVKYQELFKKYRAMIPDNTGPDGSISKALAAINELSRELAQNSGVNNPFGSPNVGLIVGLVCLALFVGVGIGVGVLIAVLAFKGYIPLKCNEESPAEQTGVARLLKEL